MKVVQLPHREVPNPTGCLRRQQGVVSWRRLHQSPRKRERVGEKPASEQLLRDPSNVLAGVGILCWRNHLFCGCFGFAALAGLLSGIGQVGESGEHHHRDNNRATSEGN